MSPPRGAAPSTRLQELGDPIDYLVLVNEPSGSPVPPTLMASAIKEHMNAAADPRWDLGTHWAPAGDHLKMQTPLVSSYGPTFVMVPEDLAWDFCQTEGVSTVDLPRLGKRPPLRLRIAEASSSTDCAELYAVKDGLERRHGRLRGQPPGHSAPLS